MMQMHRDEVDFNYWPHWYPFFIRYSLCSLRNYWLDQNNYPFIGWHKVNDLEIHQIVYRTWIQWLNLEMLHLQTNLYDRSVIKREFEKEIRTRHRYLSGKFYIHFTKPRSLTLNNFSDTLYAWRRIDGFSRVAS